MTTVSWNVQVQFPEPFATFERLLSVLDLSLLRIMPISCMVEYDFITDFYVIVLTPLVMAGMIIVAGVARAAYRPEKRDQISYIHSSLLLLLSFLVLPATSMKVRERCVGQLVLTIVEDHVTRSI
jgi:hypothetical protein